MTAARRGESHARPARSEGNVYLSLTISQEALDRIDEQCEKRVVGRAFIVKRALDKYLTELEAQEDLP